MSGHVTLQASRSRRGSSIDINDRHGYWTQAGVPWKLVQSPVDEPARQGGFRLSGRAGGQFPCATSLACLEHADGQRASIRPASSQQQQSHANSDSSTHSQPPSRSCPPLALQYHCIKCDILLRPLIPLAPRLPCHHRSRHALPPLAVAANTAALLSSRRGTSSTLARLPAPTPLLLLQPKHTTTPLLTRPPHLLPHSPPPASPPHHLRPRAFLSLPHQPTSPSRRWPRSVASWSLSVTVPVERPVCSCKCRSCC